MTTKRTTSNTDPQSHDLLAYLEHDTPQTDEDAARGAGKRSIRMIARTVEHIAALLVTQETRQRGRWKQSVVDELEAILKEYPIPPVRAECRYGVRPCPHTSCRYHLISKDPREENEKVRPNYPNLESMPMTCALDVAENIGIITREPENDHAMAAHLLRVTRERSRQLFKQGMEKLRAWLEQKGITMADVVHLFRNRGEDTLSDLVSPGSGTVKIRRSVRRQSTAQWPDELDVHSIRMLDDSFLDDLPPPPDDFSDSPLFGIGKG